VKREASQRQWRQTQRSDNNLSGHRRSKGARASSKFLNLARSSQTKETIIAHRIISIHQFTFQGMEISLQKCRKYDFFNLVAYSGSGIEELRENQEAKITKQHRLNVLINEGI